MTNLWDYAQGKRQGKEAHQFEWQALSDPFLQDAIDGYDQIDEQPADRLKKIKKEITKQTKEKSGMALFWGIICAIGLICISIFFFFNEKVFPPDNTGYNEDKVVKFFSQGPSIDKPAVSDVEKTGEHQKTPVVSIDTATVATDSQQTNAPVEKERYTFQPVSVREFDYDWRETLNRQFKESNSYTLSNEETQAILSRNRTAVVKTTVRELVSKPVVGEKAYIEYLESNVKKLSNNICEGRHGTVILLFNVNEKGRPVNIAVLRSLCREADREVIRILQNGPDWTVSNLTARLEVAL